MGEVKYITGSLLYQHYSLRCPLFVHLELFGDDALKKDTANDPEMQVLFDFRISILERSNFRQVLKVENRKWTD